MQKYFILLLSFIIFLSSCTNPNYPNDNNNETSIPEWQKNTNHSILKNNWKSKTDDTSIYKYDGENFTYISKDVTVFKIKVEEIVWNNDNTSGVIYGKITENTDSSLINKYYSIAFMGLKTDSVQFSSDIALATTLEESKNNFISEYFKNYIECVESEYIYIEAGKGNRNYRLLSDEKILALNWQDKRKQDYFYSNWMNIFTNQIIVPAGGVTTATRETDEKGTYLENGDVLGNFIYATNIEWKGTNWIGALYEDPRRAGQDSRWMLFHIDTEGNLMLGSGLGTGATGSTPPTDNDWKTLVYDKWGAYSIGTIKDFNYNQQQ